MQLSMTVRRPIEGAIAQTGATSKVNNSSAIVHCRRDDRLDEQLSREHRQSPVSSQRTE